MRAFLWIVVHIIHLLLAHSCEPALPSKRHRCFTNEKIARHEHTFLPTCYISIIHAFIKCYIALYAENTSTKRKVVAYVEEQ